MENCRLLALADIRPITDLALPVPLYRGLDEMLKEAREIEVVSIATPNGLHEAHAIRCLRAGKHVVVEKPMALNLASCERMTLEAERAGRELFCVLQNRYSPAIQWLKNQIEKAALGKVFMVQVNCFWNRDERYYKQGSWHGTRALDGGTLFTQFSHFIDILYFLFGDITNIQSKLAYENHVPGLEIEDAGMIMFDFVNGGLGNLNFTTAAWNHNIESSITILAEQGTVKISGQYMNQLHVSAIDNISGVPHLQNAGSDNHRPFFQQVADQLLGKKPPAPENRDGKKVVEIIERIYQSAGIGTA